MTLVTIRSSNKSKIEDMEKLFNDYYPWETAMMISISKDAEYAELVMDISETEDSIETPSIGVMNILTNDTEITDFEVDVFSNNSSIMNMLLSDTCKNLDESNVQYNLNKYGDDEIRYISITWSDDVLCPYISLTLIDDSDF